MVQGILQTIKQLMPWFHSSILPQTELLDIVYLIFKFWRKETKISNNNTYNMIYNVNSYISKNVTSNH